MQTNSTTERMRRTTKEVPYAARRERPEPKPQKEPRRVYH